MSMFNKSKITKQKEDIFSSEIRWNVWNDLLRKMAGAITPIVGAPLTLLDYRQEVARKRIELLLTDTEKAIEELKRTGNVQVQPSSDEERLDIFEFWEGIMILASRSRSEKKIQRLGIALARTANGQMPEADHASRIIKALEEITDREYVLLQQINNASTKREDGLVVVKNEIKGSTNIKKDFPDYTELASHLSVLGLLMERGMNATGVSAFDMVALTKMGTIFLRLTHPPKNLNG